MKLVKLFSKRKVSNLKQPIDSNMKNPNSQPKKTQIDITLINSNYKPYNVPTHSKFDELKSKGYKDIGFCCIGITDSCFFKCKMCDKWKEDVLVEKIGSSTPSMNDWKRFLDQLSEMVSHKLKGPTDTRFEINFAGGEALSHPYTVDLIKHASSLGFNTVIASNGWLINKRMAKRLHDAGLYGVNLSLDSLDPKIHDEYRGFKGATKGVMIAIDNLSKYPYPRPGIISIIHKDTISGLKDMVLWTHKNPKIIWHNLMAIMQPNNTIFESNWFKKEEFIDLWPKNTEQVIEFIDWLIEFKRRNRDEKLKNEMPVTDKNVNTYPQLNAFKEYFRNPETFSKNDSPCNLDKGLQVSAMGDIFMCIHKDILGNVKHNDIRTVWKSKEAEKTRHNIHTCKTNCHTLLNCYFEEDYPFTILSN